MPILKHAKKKLRQDKKRTDENKKTKVTYRKLVKKSNTEKTSDSLSMAFSSIDKAAKKNIIHKNKAARMKSALAKKVSGTGKAEKSPAKKAASASAKAKKGTTKKKVKSSSKKTK